MKAVRIQKPADMIGQNMFKVNALARNGPLDLTICDGSAYGAVYIEAGASNAPARVSLDSAFEGTFVAKVVDPGESQGASVTFDRVRWHSGYERVLHEPLKTRHVHAGAVGWGSVEDAASAMGFAEVRSVHGSAHIDF